MIKLVSGEFRINGRRHVSGINERIVSLYSRDVEKGEHIVRKGLAITVTVFVDHRGLEWLVSADAQLDTYIACLVLKVMVKCPRLFFTRAILGGEIANVFLCGF